MSDGYVNLTLAVLNEARRDNAKMWKEFTETQTYKAGLGKVDSLALACDLGSYLWGE